ncbi:M48 family metallopeptidase [Cerasicoccus fimbriatus]|uniref:M48 family metallopeptidase n=1 Tax=Cerasicoccus fimbriatus TaxID=3014554 RepID=UPI0022B580D8|nr:M48 family metallopeptidase [Cerasicoccus sp. TK19100]
MDFFSAQDEAHSRTKLLVIYFIMAVLCIIAALYALCMVFYSYGTTPENQPVQWVLWQPAVLAGVGGFVVLLVGGASLGKIAELKGGGGVVAKSVGGRKVDPGTSDPDERKLMNVIEEMAIASGTPVPEVYLLDREDGINGFAAGYTPDDAAIAVTRGCVQRLSRDELQGVIAHEFSHILNGDMRMNIKLMGVLFGILLISIIGEGIMRAGFWSNVGRRRDDKGGNAIMLFGIGMMAIGWIGVFFGRLIQSAISRQREYLADASAVQFTRNPNGIGGALMKIGGAGSVVNHHHTSETAHFFFANALKSSFGGAFATHPPLPDRIKRVMPNWDGKFGSVAAAPKREATKPPPIPSGQGKHKVNPAEWVAGVGVIGASQLAYAQQSRAQAEESLGEQIHDSSQAGALVLALLLDRNSEVRQKQLNWLEQDGGKELADAVAENFPKAQAQGIRQRIPLIEMTLPALAQISRQDYDALLKRIVKLSEADQEISFFEFAVMRLVKRHLGRKFEGAHAKTNVITSTGPLREHFSMLLSTMIWAGEPANDAEAKQIFDQAIQQAPLFHGQIQLKPVDQLSFNDLDKALDVLADARFGTKRQMLAACATAVGHDGEVTTDEAELIRAVAVTLDCPMPPLV